MAIKIHAIKCGNVSYVGSKTKYGVYCYLVEHPEHGLILIDTGLNADAKDTWPKYLLAMEHVEITKEETALYKLGKMGISADDIDLLLLTHLDADSNGAIGDFAGRVKRIILPEHEYFYSCRTVYKMRQPQNLWLQYKNLMDIPYYEAVKIGPQGRGYDVFKDESIVFIHTPGHTEGHASVMIGTAGSGRLLNNDGIYFGGRYVMFSADGEFKPMTFDKKGQAKAEKYFDDVRKDPDCLMIYPSHSADDLCGYMEIK